MMDRDIDINLDLPNLVVSIPTGSPLDAEIELSYDLADLMTVEGGGVEVLEVTETGIVVEDSEGETHHIDLRPVMEDLNDE